MGKKARALTLVCESVRAYSSKSVATQHVVERGSWQRRIVTIRGMPADEGGSQDIPVGPVRVTAHASVVKYSRARTVMKREFHRSVVRSAMSICDLVSTRAMPSHGGFGDGGCIRTRRRLQPVPVQDHSLSLQR